MGNRGSLAFSARTNKSLALFVAALFIFSLALFATAAAMPKSALAADGDPVVTQVEAKGCNGVLPTPGSENTNKRLVGGSLVPGGSATFEISYPVSASDVAGRTTFVIDDCVFIDGTAALEYEVSFVPNTENFLLTFTLQIPAGTPIGAEYCNYAKTTAAPSDSPASNRKAGPACFVVGGNITVLKTNEAGDPLAGAHFHVVCTIPTTDAFLPDTIIDGVSHDSTSGGVITQNVVTDETGRIAIQAPVGTSCVITETQAPEGYDIATPDHVTLVASAEGADHTFVDPPAFVPAPAVTIVKSVSATGENGTFVNQLETTIGATVHYRITITNTGNVDLTEVALTDDLFQTAVDNCDVPTTLAVGAHFDCNYTAEAAAGTTKNTATVDTKETPPEDDDATVVVGTGSLKVTKVIPNVP
ncbi:MAG TPA: SpaA isopeptide-forming pilin-related protein, partial [Ilumatobacteraceae bacterium]